MSSAHLDAKPGSSRKPRKPTNGQHTESAKESVNKNFGKRNGSILIRSSMRVSRTTTPNPSGIMLNQKGKIISVLPPEKQRQADQ